MALCALKARWRSDKLVAIAVEAVEITGDGEDLGQGGEFMPAARVSHFPTEPVYAGGQCQARGVISGSGQVNERPC